MNQQHDHTPGHGVESNEPGVNRARRWAVAGSAALALAIGGVGTAYAVGGGTDTTESGYATIVESPENPNSADVEIAGGTEGTSGSTATREDCPEKSGGESGQSEGSQPGTSQAPSQAPSDTPSDTPDTSTL